MRIAIAGSETNRIAILQCDAESRLRQTGKPIAIRSSKYMNNMIEQDHRRIAVGITLAGIERIQIMRKEQDIFEYQKTISIKQ